MQGNNRGKLAEEIEAMKQRIADLEASNEQALRAVHRAEQRYTDLFENAGDSIYIIDAIKQNIINANGHASRRLGYTHQELLQLKLDDIEVVPPDDGIIDQTRWKSNVSQTTFYECWYRRKDGSLISVEVSSRIVTTDSVLVFQKFVRDVTRRKELEAARKQAEAEALRLATLIQQATETIFITDLDGKIIYANPHFEVTTGYTLEEALGKKPNLFKSGEQDDAIFADLWATILRGDHWHGTFTNRRKDGTLYYEDATIFPLKDAENRIAHYAAVKRDITERVIAEREREQLISELDAFAHTVAHDLKSPLMLVRGYSNLLVEGFEEFPSAQIREMLQSIDNGGAKMTRIIDELLLLASTRQSTDVPKVPLDMITIINEALARLKLLIEEHSTEIVFLNPDEWPVALGYAPWVEEVWANYISNALKYGGATPRIELGAAQENEHTVSFWVRDYGAGISAEKQTQLFKPFTRLSDLRVQGHGLGLSIVARIVSKLGGEVGVVSLEGEGSVFSFTLPRYFE
jgi:PAS domain S-box-containing protein